MEGRRDFVQRLSSGELKAELHFLKTWRQAAPDADQVVDLYKDAYGESVAELVNDLANLVEVVCGRPVGNIERETWCDAVARDFFRAVSKLEDDSPYPGLRWRSWLAPRGGSSGRLREIVLNHANKWCCLKFQRCVPTHLTMSD
ncbi:MAG: hypothetical protein JSU63_00565 [Phycisphaerales bacterium]|nr:MAG: hypothetical protein JSU63_00565 [Phycisphaerales bacterium]